jgi:hypothetical protein
MNKKGSTIAPTFLSMTTTNVVVSFILIAVAIALLTGGLILIIHGAVSLARPHKKVAPALKAPARNDKDESQPTPYERAA